jgi:2-amino-4-hydroxy-6-hydroxymethyldihydropteridine diphosphokinase
MAVIHLHKNTKHMQAPTPTDPLSIRTYLALGSNINPCWHLQQAMQHLQQLPQSTWVGASPCYSTAPWGGVAQSAFINLAVALDTTLTPLQLFFHTQNIEKMLGRQRQQRYGSRTIDIDLLLYGDQIIDDTRLRIPHPGLVQRDFMLYPVLNLDSQAYHPDYQQPILDLQALVTIHCITKRCQRWPDCHALDLNKSDRPVSL